MGLFQDLTGQRFGRLTVMHRAENRGGRVFWHCLCDCGNEKDIPASTIKDGRSRSCGCLNIESSSARRKDLTGQKFGRLTVLRLSNNRGSSKKLMWVCQCNCGKICEVNGTLMANGSVRSCGCLATEVRVQTGRNSRGRKSSRFIDLTGQRFGRLKVIERGENGKNGQTRWRCICDCGKETLTAGNKLRSGLAKSCGCLGLENATKAKITHGQANTPLYQLFKWMHNRCELKTSNTYKWYGAKGITVCDEWKEFHTFQKWALDNGYQVGLSIDRLDPTKGYSPENCEFVTRSENARRMHKAHGHKLRS